MSKYIIKVFPMTNLGAGRYQLTCTYNYEKWMIIKKLDIVWITRYCGWK